MNRRPAAPREAQHKVRHIDTAGLQSRPAIEVGEWILRALILVLGGVSRGGQVKRLALAAADHLVGDRAQHALGERVLAALGGERAGGDREDLATDERREHLVEPVLGQP